MVSARAAQEVLYDPSDPGYRTDPYPLYARLRSAAPVHRSPLGFWVLTRYADIDLVQRDPRCVRGLTPDDGMVAAWGGWESPITAEMGGWMLHKDGVDHARLRALVARAFHPSAIPSMRDRIQGIVDGLLDQVVAAGRMDVIADLALPLPVAVIGGLLGLRATDHERIGHWGRALARAFDEVLTPETLHRTAMAIQECSGFVRNHLADAAGLHSEIVAKLRAAEGGDGLSDSELVSTVNLLLFAGFETTRNLIGNGFLALLGNPVELERLRARPELVPNGVLELLRYDAPVQPPHRTGSDRGRRRRDPPRGKDAPPPGGGQPRPRPLQRPGQA